MVSSYKLTESISLVPEDIMFSPVLDPRINNNGFLLVFNDAIDSKVLASFIRLLASHLISQQRRSLLGEIKHQHCGPSLLLSNKFQLGILQVWHLPKRLFEQNLGDEIQNPAHPWAKKVLYEFTINAPTFLHRFFVPIIIAQKIELQKWLDSQMPF
jgi:hypothetical protein